MAVSKQGEIDFINANLGYAQQVAAQTGLPVDYVLGQSAAECLYGTSSYASSQNNYFGVKNPGSSSFASYASPANSFASYGNLMSGPRYAAACQSSTDPTTLAHNIAAAGYDTEDGVGNYATLVGSVTARIAYLRGENPNLGANAVTSNAIGNSTSTSTSTNSGDSGSSGSSGGSGSSSGGSSSGGSGGSSGGGGGSSGGSSQQYNYSHTTADGGAPGAGLPVARLGDLVYCPVHGINQIITVVNEVYTNGRNTVRIGAIAHCGAVVIVGSDTVLTQN